MTHLTLYNKDTLIYYSDNITLMTLPWLAHATKLIDQYYLHHNRLLLFWVWKHLKNRWTHVECGAVVLPNHNVYTFGVNTNLKLYLCPRVSSTATFPCFAASHNIQFLKGVWNTYHWGTKSLWEVVSVATKHGKEADLYAYGSSVANKHMWKSAKNLLMVFIKLSLASFALLHRYFFYKLIFF